MACCLYILEASRVLSKKIRKHTGKIMPFVRPASIPFPSIWHRFERTTKDGKTKKFFVQDATEDMFPFLADYMCEEFIYGEPMCKSIGVGDDAESVEGMQRYWRELLEDRMAIVCFEEDPKRPGKPLHFVGCNMCYAAYADDKDNKEVIGEKWNIIYDAVCYCVQESEKIRKYPLYLNAMGLSVKKSYQGMSIGKEILDARTGLCKACDIPVTITIFTNISSQKVAHKSGFKNLYEIDYEELRKVDPRFQFNIESTKSAIIMYKNIV